MAGGVTGAAHLLGQSLTQPRHREIEEGADLDRQGAAAFRPLACAVVIATIAVELGGSSLLILRRWAWLSAGALGAFTAIATLIAHCFWTIDDPVEHFRGNGDFDRVSEAAPPPVMADWSPVRRYGGCGAWGAWEAVAAQRCDSVRVRS